MPEFYITPESIAEHIGNLFVLGSQLIITCIIKKTLFLSRSCFQQRPFFFDCRMLGENLGCVSKQKIFLQALSKHFSHTLRSSSLELDDAVFHAKSVLMVLLVQHLSVCSFQLQILLHNTWNQQTFVPVSHIARQLLNISFCSNLRLYIKDGQITSMSENWVHWHACILSNDQQRAVSMIVKRHLTEKSLITSHLSTIDPWP